MASVNKVQLIGNLGHDPETRYLPSGEAIANVTIATSRKYKNKSGEQVEETEWHRVSFFGRLAEIAAQYLHKGAPVYVEGRIHTSKYTDKSGAEKYSTEIIASEMQLLGDRNSARPSQDDVPKPAAYQSSVVKPSGSGFEDMDDSIPF